MPARLRAILPKEKISALYPRKRIQAWLKDVGEQFQEAMSVYPAKQKWKHGEPKKGPRRGGRRTGAYGRGWKNTPLVIREASVTALNPISYARYVGGPRRSTGGRTRQAKHMRARGWKSQSDVGPAIVRANLPRLRKLALPVKNPK